MSTKIYNAYEYKNDIYSLYNFLINLKDEAIDIACNIVQHSMKNYDDRYSWNDYENKIKALFQNNSAVYPNITLSMVIYPIKYKNKDRIFINYYGDLIHSVLEDKFLNNDFLDFHYQNQTDGPDDVSEDEWEERAIIWDIIFNNYTIPSQIGFIFNVVYDCDFVRMCTKLIHKDYKIYDIPNIKFYKNITLKELGYKNPYEK